MISFSAHTKTMRNLYFTDEKVEVQKDEEICPWSHSCKWWVGDKSFSMRTPELLLLSIMHFLSSAIYQPKFKLYEDILDPLEWTFKFNLWSRSDILW